MRAVLRTLAQCHHLRILHRDIKPGACARVSVRACAAACGLLGRGCAHGRRDPSQGAAQRHTCGMGGPVERACLSGPRPHQAYWACCMVSGTSQGRRKGRASRGPAFLAAVLVICPACVRDPATVPHVSARRQLHAAS